MKLTYEQIRDITVGAAHIWEDSDGVHFSKLTEEQQNAFNRLYPRFAHNGKATTGIRFDFHTNADFIRYIPLTSGKYELKVDGVLTEYIKGTAGEAIEYTFSDSATHRITLHLPSHGVGGGLISLELSDGATLERHVFDRKFLFIGDSITQGWNAELDTSSYAYLVSDHFNAESIIQGVGSAHYDAETLGKPDFAPDTIFVAYGTNDAGFSTLAEIENRCSAFFKKLCSLYPLASVYVITPPWSLKENAPVPCGTIAEVRATIRACAEQFSFKVIDGKKVIPPLPMMMADNLHPNALGFAFYAHSLIKELKQ